MFPSPLSVKAPRDARGLHFLGSVIGPTLALLLAGALGPGCSRTSASEVRLSGTFESAEALARTVVAALALEDEDTLKRLPLSQEEFRSYVWPELPASRPERRVPFEYVWGELDQKSRASVARNYSCYKGRALEFVAVRFEGDTTEYETFSVHRDARVHVRLDDGREVWLDLFGSVMESNGRYKLFSYITD